jgi:glycerophosphoryl diester phosphodiesterase
LRGDWLKYATYAHRGLHGQGRVENSPSAFTGAIEAGLGIECDVQLSADGQAMVFHDWELERLTDLAGWVRSRPADELCATALKGSDDRIWALPELLSSVGGRVPLLVEIKSRREVPFIPLCRAVRAALTGYCGQVAVMSFDLRVARWFARLAPEIVRGLVLSEQDSRGVAGTLRRHLSLTQARPDFLAYDVRSLPSRFAAARRARGLPLLTWTVSDRARLQTGRAFADALIAEGEGLAAALESA